MVVRVDGTCFRVRPIRPEDKALLTEGLRRLSAQSVHRRFLSPRTGFTRSELRYLTEVDGHDHFALVALTLESRERIVAVGRFVRLKDDPRAAEAAIVVADAHQGRGLGTKLALMLADAARERGIERFTASMHADNVPAHRLMGTLTERLTEGRAQDGVQELSMDLAA